MAAGAESIAFLGISVENAEQQEKLLANLDTIPVHFARADERLIRMLMERQSKSPGAAEISTGCDALASLDFAAEIVRAAPSGFVPFVIHGEAFADAGATAVEEIGFALAAGVDLLARLAERGGEIDCAAAAVEFGFAIGSNYFFEIAKLRAFRMEWARVVQSFGGSRQAARRASRRAPRNGTRPSTIRM